MSNVLCLITTPLPLADAETGWYYYGYRYYASAHGRWVNRDPIVESGGKNLYIALVNRPFSVIDPKGLYTTEGTGLPDDVAGKTEFNPKIIVESVDVNFCCCSLRKATWKANTAVYFQGNANSTVYKHTDLLQILAHENVHASSDDALAAKALPVAISALQGACIQKTWLSAIFTGWDWTEEQCKNKMQSEADDAAKHIEDLAMDTLGPKAHEYIGAFPTTWNPAEIQNGINGSIVGY